MEWTQTQSPPSEATLRIITSIGMVMVDVSITMDTYQQASWIAPGHQEEPGVVMGHGILSWCYTILGARTKDGQPFTNLMHYKDQIDMRVRLYLQKLIK